MTHFRVWYSLRITIIHLIISLIYFICLLIDTMFTLGTIGSMAHGIYYTCCISYMRAWVLIIGYLSLVSLRFYHPITLAYVTSRVLRPPWGHGIRYRLLRLLCGQVFEIRLTFRYLPCIFFWETLLRCLDLFRPCLDYQDHVFDEGWFDVTCFSWFVARQMPYWGIFRFGGFLWIFAEVTCSRIDDSMLSDLQPILHFDAIQGHISVRMRFTDHEGVACLSLFARCMQGWWYIRYPRDDSLVEPIESHLARHGWPELIWFFDMLHSRCHTGAYSPSWSRFIDPHWFTWSSTVMGYAPGRCSTSFCPDTPRSLSWVIQPDSYPFV